MIQFLSPKNKKYHLAFVLLIVFNLPLSQARGEMTWNGDFAFGTGYDSNVTVDEIDLNARTGDHFFKYEGKLGFEYGFSDAHTARVSLKLSEKQYADVEQLDTGSQFISAGYTYKIGKANFGVDFRHIDSELNGQGFLALKMFSPFVSGFVAKKHYLRFGTSHINKSLDSQPLRDATSNEYSLDYYYFINGLNQFVILSAKLKNENALDEVFSYDSFQLRAALEHRFELFSLPSKARVDIRIRERSYDQEINELIDGFRKDTRKRIGFSLASELTAALTLSAEAAYVDNDSDLLNLGYDETLLSMTVRYEF